MGVPPADPLWQDPGLWLSFLGAVAAGSYALACLSRLLGAEADRRASRSAYPLACLLTLLSTLPACVLDPSTPGLRPLAVFALTGLVSWLVARSEDARAVRTRTGTIIAACGLAAAVAFGAASGRALTKGWEGSAWPGAVLLASAAPAGISAVVLWNRGRSSGLDDQAVERLGRINGVAVVVELAALAGLSLAVRGPAGQGFLRWPGMLIPLFVVPVGLVAPLILGEARGARGEADAAALVLLGAFVLRAALAGFHAPYPLLFR